MCVCVCHSLLLFKRPLFRTPFPSGFFLFLFYVDPFGNVFESGSEIVVNCNLLITSSSVHFSYSVLLRTLRSIAKYITALCHLTGLFSLMVAGGGSLGEKRLTSVDHGWMSIMHCMYVPWLTT